MTDPYDRKLRPIYDAVEAKNFKNALKLSNNFLNKYPGDHSARLLRAWSQMGLGKRDEASKAVDKVLAEVPTNVQVLNLLEMLLKRLGRTIDATEAVLAASAAQPKNLELLHAVFDLHIRQLEFSKAQAVAMRLNRLQGSHWLWVAITLLLLQARAAHQNPDGQSMGADKLWTLAETLAAKQLKPSAARQGSTQEQTLLYVQILKDQGKLQEAHAVITGDLASTIQLPAERMLIQAVLASEANDIALAGKLAREVLKGDPSNAAALRLFLNSISSLDAQPPQQLDSSPVSKASTELNSLQIQTPSVQDGSASGSAWLSVAEAEKVIYGLVSAANFPISQTAMDSWSDTEAAHIVPGHAYLRGPLLARVELASRRQSHTSASTSEPTHRSSGAAHSNQTESVSDLARQVLMYYRALGHLPICASDLRQYLLQLGHQEREWLAKQLCMTTSTLSLQEERLDSTQPPDSAAKFLALRYHACFYQLEQELQQAAAQTASQALERAETIVNLYVGGLVHSEGLDEKERGPADELIFLAVACLVGAAKADPLHGAAWLVRAYLTVEAAQVRRKVSAPLRLAATALAGLLGAPRLAGRQFAFLDVKHIQLDSVAGHYLYPLLQSAAALEPSQELEAAVRKLHADHAAHAADSLIEALDAGSFTKVVEFEEFRQRLARSHTLASVRQQAAIRALLTQPGSPAANLCLAEADAVGTQGLAFNEDLSCRPAWLPPHTGPPSTAAFDWWQGASMHAAGAGGSGAPCGAWWHSPRAAHEGEDEGAVRYRADCRRAIEHAKLMQWLLLVCGRGSEPCGLGTEQLQALAKTLNLDAEKLDDACDSILSGGRELDGKHAVGCLQTALFSAAHAYQELSLPDAQPSKDAQAAFAQHSTLVRRLFLALCDWATAGLVLQSNRGRGGASSNDADSSQGDDSGNGSVAGSLGSGEWTWVTLVISQAAAWIAPCLQVWLPGLKVSLPASNGDLERTHSDGCASAAHDLGEAFLKGIMSLSLALGARIDQLQRLSPDSIADELLSSTTLWEWEAQYDALHGLHSLVTDHIKMLQALQAAADALARNCLPRNAEAPYQQQSSTIRNAGA